MENLTIKDVNIIVHSNEINKFPALKEYFEQNGIKVYTKLDIKEAPENIKNEILNYGNSILINCRNEYKSTEEVRHKEGDYQCELCNQKHLKILFLVINKITNKEFWVGTTCVTEFGFEHRKNIINIALEKAFKEEINNYDELITMKSYPIVIPNEIFKKYKEAKETLKKNKKDFVQNKVVEITQSITTVNKINKIEKMLEQYVASNEYSEWVVKYEVIEWYKNLSEDNPIKKQNELIFERLLLNGFYSEDDISLIREGNHRRLIQNLFMNLVSNPEFKFEVQRNKLILNMRYNHSTLKYELSEDELYTAYKNEIYNKNNIFLDTDISRYTSIVKSIENIKLILNILDKKKIIESFNITDNILFVEADKDYIYKLELNDALDYLNTNMNLEEYLKSKDRPFKISKIKFNSYIEELSSYKERIIINRISTIKY